MRPMPLLKNRLFLNRVHVKIASVRRDKFIGYVFAPIIEAFKTVDTI